MMKLNIVVSFDLRQGINQWLCIALLASITFVMVLYYSVNKATIIGDAFVAERGLTE